MKKRKNNKSLIQSEVMREIECGELCMKSKWMITMEQIGLVCFVILIFLTSAVFFTLLDYWARTIGGYENLWGEYSEVFWDDFPLLWLVYAVFLLLVGTKLYGKIGENYKKIRILKVLISVTALIVFCAILVLAERFLIEI